MARTIAEIKKEMTDTFLRDETIQSLYGVVSNQSFESQFSKISLESILFYIVATCVWTLETLFDRHRQEVTELIDNLRPHTLRWYAEKAKAFQCNCTLIPDTDQYDNDGLTDEDIREKQIVKYAAVSEQGAIVYVKVATGKEGDRKPLTLEQEAGLTNYFKEIKDAGVKLIIVNKPPVPFNIDIDVYYNPQVFNNTLTRIAPQGGGQQTVHATIASFVENLPFNGEYHNSALIETLLKVEGVVLVELKQATADGETINAKKAPESGYFHVNKNELKINAIAYETVSN